MANGQLFVITQGMWVVEDIPDNPYILCATPDMGAEHYHLAGDFLRERDLPPNRDLPGETKLYELCLKRNVAGTGFPNPNENLEVDASLNQDLAFVLVKLPRPTAVYSYGSVSGMSIADVSVQGDKQPVMRVFQYDFEGGVDAQLTHTQWRGSGEFATLHLITAISQSLDLNGHSLRAHLLQHNKHALEESFKLFAFQQATVSSLGVENPATTSLPASVLAKLLPELVEFGDRAFGLANIVNALRDPTITARNSILAPWNPILRRGDPLTCLRIGPIAPVRAPAEP